MPSYRFRTILEVDAENEVEAKLLAHEAINKQELGGCALQKAQCKNEDCFSLPSQEFEWEPTSAADTGAEVRPRYTVELTTEGWQIKDNEQGVLLADAYGSEWLADSEAHELNREGR
jgi:hypothetical protein